MRVPFPGSAPCAVWPYPRGSTVLPVPSLSRPSTLSLSIASAGRLIQVYRRALRPCRPTIPQAYCWGMMTCGVGCIYEGRPPSTNAYQPFKGIISSAWNCSVLAVPFQFCCV